MLVLVRNNADLFLPVGFPATLKHSFQHQVEPEAVKEEKNAKEPCQHADKVGVPGLSLPVLRFFINASDHMAREIPKPKVHPGNDHQDVATYLEGGGSDIDDHLENTDSEIGDIVQNHHRCADWKVVDHIREVDKCEGQEVMKDVFGEVVALAIENNRIAELVEVVGQLEDVEVVHHAWQFLARVVEEE